MEIKIDGKEVEVCPGETILEVCRRENIPIPTLCYHEAFGGQGACRMCMVEVKEGDCTRMVASCTYPIHQEIEVITMSEKINRVRSTLAMLQYRRAPNSEYIRQLYDTYHVEPMPLALVDPMEKCILCRLCVNACEQMGRNAIAMVRRGIDKKVSTPFDEAADDCIGCMACVQVCPTGAIQVMEEAGKRVIWNKSFDLITCDRCGKPFATRDEIAYMEKKTNLYEYEHLCERCRPKAMAKKMEALNRDNS
ncbi:MAG: 2Fe-2S iron-sulfur cluster-binding protein [Bacillota bacterium]|nr:2Fe-2S iron-sulfur cluster-binding protein [Bacillota bacterium]